MGQIQKPINSEKQTSSNLETNRAAFEKLKQTPITRTVYLEYKSCCGCGCGYITIKREVPFDSELQDGDIIDDVLDTDKY